MWILLILLGIASVFVFTWLYINRDKINAKIIEIIIITILHVVIGVLTVKFFALVEAGFNFEKAGSMSLFGGVFFMPLFYMVYGKIKKLSMKTTFDVFTICLVTTFFFARMNCLFAGCCYGKLIGSSEYRYPTRELELAYYCILLLVLLPRVYKNKENGFAFVLYLFSYGLFRFTVEFFRHSDNDTIFHIAHIWSVVAIIIGVMIYISLRKEKANE